MNKKLITAVMAIGLIISVSSTNVYADSTSDKAKIHQIQIERKDIENKIQDMNNQHETIMSKINSNESNINITQKYIEETKINIQKAEDDIKAEQSIFNKRMRIMYMNGSTSYINIMLGSEDMGDFISKVENIKKIVTYDEKIINGLKTKQEAVNLKKVALETGNTKLLSLRAENKNNLDALTKQRADQNVLVAELNAEEKQYGAQLVIAQATELRQAIIAKQELDQKAKKALKTSETTSSTTAQTGSGALQYGASDLDLLARIITAEAGGECYNAQVAVGAVVVNRVKSSSFPNSISAVIYQNTYGRYEFTPVLNGNINRPAQASAVQAAREALGGADPTNNALFFYSGDTPSGLTSPQPVSIRIGNLTFIYMI